MTPPRPACEHPLQRRVGNKSAVPIILTVDFGGREARREGAAGDNMLRSNAMGCGVEIGKISSTHAHCADAEARESGVDKVEIHKTLKVAFSGLLS